ncbi:exodeoxyribonuclease I subunit C [Methylobacter tundripaludum]|uniref:Exodeoxyribonuclease I n=1 Tax=Methylobacter tundripaludum TaxID=173365 RepID=A0A2S6GST9_9GAMM|nr:exodeoxyribonuclease I [Methylobacter tundripaludum]PPK68191.1 exodeoxyribonuclease I subunit C [Methylobacter tundripaludum]
MSGTQTFYWHDYETFGTDPRRDRPVQFAGIRTDFDFNIVDDPLVVYCKPAADCLPHPEACLITGITPQLAEQKGVCEAEFIRLIHQQLAQPNTCTLGYNSLRFDDEVTRNCLYRNFYDPYAREWQNGNSRWDLIDVVRAARALRPEGVVWPVNEQGGPSFRLDQLTQANNITHEAAHDALSDVYATIAIAKLVKQAQPKLYQFLLQHRIKAEALNLLQFGSFKPVVHVSGKYPASKHCLAIVLPVCKHPANTNGVIVYDLSIDPGPMLELSVGEIQQRIFTATADLPEDVARIPLKTVHINKCPVLAPVSVIRPEDAQRLEVDLALCYANIDKIKAAIGLADKVAAVFSGQNYAEQGSDPDLEIYSGGFFSESDKGQMFKIRNMQPRQLADSTFKFIDSRLPEMLFRYRARNYPETLRADELQNWNAFCVSRLSRRQTGSGIVLDDYFSRLDELRRDENVNREIINALEDYAFEKMRKFGIKQAGTA